MSLRSLPRLAQRALSRRLDGPWFSSWRRSPRAWLTAVLILFALWLRLRHLGYTEIWHDQARTLNLTLQWLHGGPLPLTSDLTSLGVHNPPLILYLYALPLFFREDLMGVAWLLAGLSLLGVLIAACATARVFGWRVAWWSSLLLIVSPWAVYYARLIWQASFVPVFAAGLYACALLYFAGQPRGRYLFAGALFFSATFQTHVTTLTLLPVFFILGVCFYRRLHWRPLVLAAGLFLLSLAPYIVYQVRSRFADWQVMRSGLGGQLDINLTALELALDLFRSRSIYDTLGSAADLWRQADWRWLRADSLVVLWLAGAAAAAVAYSLTLLKRYERPAAGWFMLALWISLPILPFIPHTRWVINHYFLYLYPVGQVLMALLSDRLYAALVGLAGRLTTPAAQRAGRAFAGVAFLPLALIAFQQARLDVVGQNLLAAGVSGHERVVDVRQATNSARRLMAERPGCQFVVMGEELLWETSRFGLMRETLGADRVRFAESGSVRLFPSLCAVYFLVVQDSEAQAWLRAVARPLTDYTIHTPEETWTFYDLPPADREVAVARLESNAGRGVWANGLRLTSFEFRDEAATTGESQLALTYTWEVGEDLAQDLRSQPEALRFGNYLLSESNALVSQTDDIGLDSREWRRGDVFQIIWHLPLPDDLPPGDYSLATALYSLPEVRRVPLADGAGDLLFLDKFSWSDPKGLGDP